MSSGLYTGFNEQFAKIFDKSAAPPPIDSRLRILHVLDVVLDESSDYYDGPESIGMLRVRDPEYDFDMVEDEIERFAYPADRSNYRLPLPGEQVIGIRAYGVRVLGTYMPVLYYTNVITAENIISSNIMPFLGVNPYSVNNPSGGNVITQLATDVKALSKRFHKKQKHSPESSEKKKSVEKLREGDTVIEGRYGGSIKFTSTIAEDNTQPFLKNGSLDGDSLIVIKNSMRFNTDSLNYVDDDPLLDEVSVYMTTTQTIPIILSCSKKMYSWNSDIIAGNITKDDDPSVLYQKVVDTSQPFNEVYKAPDQQ